MRPCTCNESAVEAKDPAQVRPFLNNARACFACLRLVPMAHRSQAVLFERTDAPGLIARGRSTCHALRHAPAAVVVDQPPAQGAMRAIEAPEPSRGLLPLASKLTRRGIPKLTTRATSPRKTTEARTPVAAGCRCWARSAPCRLSDRRYFIAFIGGQPDIDLARLDGGDDQRLGRTRVAAHDVGAGAVGNLPWAIAIVRKGLADHRPVDAREINVDQDANRGRLGREPAAAAQCKGKNLGKCIKKRQPGSGCTGRARSGPPTAL